MSLACVSGWVWGEEGLVRCRRYYARFFSFLNMEMKGLFLVRSRGRSHARVRGLKVSSFTAGEMAGRQVGGGLWYHFYLFT